MIFNKHLNLVGRHAYLGASQYHWINYDDEKLADRFNGMLAKQVGTELHEFAALCIKLKQKLPKSNKSLNTYINDAIGFRMIPEQLLYFSDNCFGTADAILFKDNYLRIHDYKSGVVPAHIEQLLIYDALFCLEYKVKPTDITIENRIYQSGEVIVVFPEASDIISIMERIVSFNNIIEKIKQQEV